jgi:hypothetical protein
MRNYLLPALSTLLLFSCSKEESQSSGKTAEDPIPQFAVTKARFTSTSSKFLKRELLSNSNNPRLWLVKQFSYDNTNRCTEIKIGTIDSSVSSPAFALRQTLTFDYDGPASLQPASFSSVRTVFPNLVTTFYCMYNLQGRKIKDSVRVKNQAGDPADRIVNYTYSYDKVTAIPFFRGFPLENNSFDTLSLLSDGNIGKRVSRHIRSTGDQIIQYTFNYDNAISPYNKLNIANSLYFESGSAGVGFNVSFESQYMGVTTNNVTSYTTGNHTVRFRYWYDQDNYPVRKEMYWPGETTPSQITLFEY